MEGRWRRINKFEQRQGTNNSLTKNDIPEWEA
jgi:hypothetical protein